MSNNTFIKGIAKLKILFCYSFFLLLFASCSAQTQSSKAEGILAEQIIYRQQNFDVVTVDLKKMPIHFFWKNKDGKLIRSLGKLKKMVEAEDKKLLFGMNAGMYQRDRSPQGLYIENGKTLQKLDTLKTGYGNFYLQPNGVFFIKNETAGILPTTKFSKREKEMQPTWATQSGPLLLIDEKVHPIFREGSTNLNIRNGVGIISEHEVVFVISHKEVNLFDFAMLFKEKLNCKNALYLDGFVSRAYIPQLGRKDLDGDFGVIIGVKE